MSISKIANLANRLEQCIRSDPSRYAPGKPFMTTQQLAAHLKIDGTLANRVLQLLEKRQVIIRKQRVGSIIAPPREDVAVDQITVFLHERYYKQPESFETTGRYVKLFFGIQEQFPGVAFHTAFVESADLEKKTHDLLSGDKREAFVLWSAPLEIQRLFAESRLPTVLFGTRYYSVEGLPSIDIDHDAATRTIVEYLKGRNRRRFALLCHSSIAAGDQTMIDGYQKRAASKIVAWRFLPRDEKVCESAAEGLWADRPDAIVCHSELMAGVVTNVCRKRNREPGRDVDVIAYYANPDLKHDIPIVERLDGFFEVGSLIGKALTDRIGGQSVADVRLPVRLREP